MHETLNYTLAPYDNAKKKYTITNFVCFKLKKKKKSSLLLPHRFGSMIFHKNNFHKGLFGNEEEQPIKTSCWIAYKKYTLR